MRLGSSLVRQAGHRIDLAVRHVRGGRSEVRRLLVLQLRKNRQGPGERFQRRQRPEGVRPPEIPRETLLGDEEPTHSAAGQQPHPDEFAARQSRLDELQALVEGTQRAPIATVAQQSTCHFFPPGKSAGDETADDHSTMLTIMPGSMAFEPRT